MCVRTYVYPISEYMHDQGISRQTNWEFNLLIEYKKVKLWLFFKQLNFLTPSRLAFKWVFDEIFFPRHSDLPTYTYVHTKARCTQK